MSFFIQKSFATITIGVKLFTPILSGRDGINLQMKWLLCGTFYDEGAST